MSEEKKKCSAASSARTKCNNGANRILSAWLIKSICSLKRGIRNAWLAKCIPARDLMHYTGKEEEEGKKKKQKEQKKQKKSAPMSC